MVKITSSESLGSCVEGKTTSTLTVTSDATSTVTSYIEYYYVIGDTVSEVTVTTVEPDASIELTAEVSHSNQITWYYRTSISNSFSGEYTSVVSETVDCPERITFLPSISDINITSNENFAPYDFNIDRNRIDVSFNYISGTEASADVVFQFIGKNTGTLIDTSNTDIENISGSGIKTASFRIFGAFVPDEYYIHWVKYENITDGPSDCPSVLEVYSSGSINTDAVGCVVNDDFIDGTHDLLSSDDAFVFIEDNEAPTWNNGSNLQISDFSSSEFTLTWSTCSDSNEIIYFQLYVNGTLEGGLWDGNDYGAGAWENSWDGMGTATISASDYGLSSFNFGDVIRIECRDSSSNISTDGPEITLESPEVTSFSINTANIYKEDQSTFIFDYTIDPGVVSSVDNLDLFNSIVVGFGTTSRTNFGCLNISNITWSDEEFSGTVQCTVNQSSYMREGREIDLYSIRFQYTKDSVTRQVNYINNGNVVLSNFENYTGSSTHYLFRNESIGTVLSAPYVYVFETSSNFNWKFDRSHCCIYGTTYAYSGYIDDKEFKYEYSSSTVATNGIYLDNSYYGDFDDITFRISLGTTKNLSFYSKPSSSERLVAVEYHYTSLSNKLFFYSNSSDNSISSSISLDVDCDGLFKDTTTASCSGTVDGESLTLNWDGSDFYPVTGSGSNFGPILAHFIKSVSSLH